MVGSNATYFLRNKHVWLCLRAGFEEINTLMKRKAGGRAGDGNRNRRARTEGVEGEIFPLNELPDMILALIVR